MCKGGRCCGGGGWLFQGCACGEYISMGEYDGTRGLLSRFVCFTQRLTGIVGGIHVSLSVVKRLDVFKDELL